MYILLEWINVASLKIGMILDIMLGTGITFFYLSPMGCRNLGLGGLSWPCQLGTEPGVGERELCFCYLFFDVKNLPIKYFCGFIFLLKITLTVSYFLTPFCNAELG